MVMEWKSTLNYVGSDDFAAITVAVLEVCTLFHISLYTIILKVYMSLEEEDKRDMVFSSDWRCCQ